MAYTSPSITPSGTTFAQFQAGGPSGEIARLIASNLAASSPPSAAVSLSATGGGQSISNPASAITASSNGGGRTIARPSTAATLSATGGGSTGGSFPAETVYVGYTWVTACGGETTLGSSQASVTVAAGNIPGVTIPSLPAGAVSANIYVGTVSGVLYLYKKGITGTVALLDSSTWYGNVAMTAAPSPPAVNTTVGAIPANSTGYYAAATEYHGFGETTIGSSVTAAAFTIAANAAPSGAPTGAGSGASGNLPAGAYYYRVSYVDAWGNETAGTEGGATTITAGQSLVVTFADTAPDWVVARNLYLTAAGGATGTETLYATGINPTASTYTCSSASWTNGTTTQAAARAVLTSGTSAAQVPSLTLPGLSTGATGQRVYLSAPGGSNTALVEYASGVTGTTFYMAAAPYLGNTFANGTSPPASNTTAGGLPSGTIYVRITETDGVGETTANAEASVSIAAGNIPLVTFNALQPGNVARNVYVGTAGGAETLYATGVTAAALGLYAAQPTNSYAGTVPTVNTTGLAFVDAQGVTHNRALQYLDACIRNPSAGMVKPWLDAVQLVGQFNRGQPVGFGGMVTQFRHAHTFYAALAQAFSEMGALIDANPGHFTTTTNAIGDSKTVRAWP